MPELRVTPVVVIPESELSEDFILSSGAGGQNVNKVASAVQLRFDALHSPSLPDDVRVRLLRLAGHRLTKEGVVIDSIVRFLQVEPAQLRKKRKPTRPTRASKERRIESKKRTSATKRQRAKKFED